MRGRAIPFLVGAALLFAPAASSAQTEPAVTLIQPDAGARFYTTDAPLFMWDAGALYETQPWDGATLMFRRAHESPDGGFGTFVPFPDQHDRFFLDFVRRGGTIPDDYLWRVCVFDLDADDPDESSGPCSDERRIRIGFRLPTLTKRDALDYARSALARAARWPLTLGDNYRRSCRRQTRARMRCRVSTFAGDSVVVGTVAIRLYRRGNSAYYSARFTGRWINEYCVHVTKDHPCSRRLSKRIGGRHVSI